MIAGFVRGLSFRDVEAALTEALGESATVSRSTVSRICTEIQAHEAWSARRLDDVELDYLFLDGSHFKYHANAAAEPVLAAWGIDTDGNHAIVSWAGEINEWAGSFGCSRDGGTIVVSRRARFACRHMARGTQDGVHQC